MFGELGMADLVLETTNVLRGFAWGGIAVVVVILVLTLGFARILRTRRKSDLTRDGLRLLKAFTEQAKRDPRAYLSVEFAAYRAQVKRYDVALQRLKDLGYVQDSNIDSGYLGHRPVWITVEGMRRARRRR